MCRDKIEMNLSDYQTLQKITIVDNLKQAEFVSLESIINKNVLGVDCEWNSSSGSKISMVQVATCDDVFLFRITKFPDKRIPKSLNDILQNGDIIKVGVNIENDAKMLRKQYQCNLEGFVDLRNLAVTKTAYGKVLLKKLQKFEEELAILFPEDNEDEILNLESKRRKKSNRYSWCPKLGLGSLTEDCLGVRLQKESTARWQDDWEAYSLSQEQIKYAAADGAVALDIFYALMAEKDLGVPFNVSEIEWGSDIKDQLTKFCGRAIGVNVKQKSLVSQCYSQITALDKEFDLTDYMTKPVQKNKNKTRQPAKRPKLYAGFDEQLANVHKIVRKKPLYENCKLYAPDGTLLCTCNKRKINWYLSNNLAEPIEQAEGEPIAAKLLFEPSGKPLNSSDFYCQDKINECCCCSRTEELVRKNVIPKEYRRHLPVEFKDRQSHDVVLLCVQCHCSSNMFDNLMREELATEHGIPINYKNNFMVLNRTKSSVRAAAKALTATNNIIPEERKLVLKQTITDYLGHEPSAEEVMELKCISINDMKCSGNAPEHGSEVVKKVIEQDKVEDFIVRWRNFFLSSMKPEHLPKGWSVDHKTRDKLKEAEVGMNEIVILEKEGDEVKMVADNFGEREDGEIDEEKPEESAKEAVYNIDSDDSHIKAETMSVE